MTVVLYKLGFVIIPAPLTKLQTPLPTPGIFPCKVIISLIIIVSLPAYAWVGKSFVITTVSVLIHPLLLTFHVNTLAPLPSPVTTVLLKFISTNNAAPLLTDQYPDPEEGSVASISEVFSQITWSTPASKSNWLFVILTSSEVLHIPFEIVQRKIFSPLLKPLTTVFGSFALSNDAAPTTTVHKPIPTAGVLPWRVVVSRHIAWSIPA